MCVHHWVYLSFLFVSVCVCVCVYLTGCLGVHLSLCAWIWVSGVLSERTHGEVPLPQALQHLS